MNSSGYTFSLWNSKKVNVTLPSRVWLFATQSQLVCSPQGSPANGIPMLEWAAIFFSRGSCQPRGQTRVSCIADRPFPSEPPGNSKNHVLFSMSLYTLLRIFSAIRYGIPFLVTSDFVELLNGMRNRQIGTIALSSGYFDVVCFLRGQRHYGILNSTHHCCYVRIILKVFQMFN